MGLLATLAEGGTTGGAEAALFWIFAAVALGSAVAVVAMRNVVHAALMLVLNLLSVAALYLGLQSSFLSIVQVIVYAGAIVVLFLFVIMLLGVDRDDLLGTRTPVAAVAAVVAGVALAGAFVAVVGAGSLTAASACGAQAEAATSAATTCVGLDEVADDSVGFVGTALFTRWTFAFEASSLLLVVATLGALVLGRRRDPAIDDELAPTAPVPGDDDVEVFRAQVDERAEGLATADVRPTEDATATLDDAADRDAPDTAEERPAGHTHDVSGSGDTTGRDA